MAQEPKYRSHGPGDGGKEATPSVDTLVSRNVLKQLQRDPPPAVKASHEPSHAHGSKALGGAGSGGDIDLVASMAKRLSLLEKESKERGHLLQRLQVENDALKAKLKVAEDEIQRHAKAQPPAGASPAGKAGGEGGAAGEEGPTAHAHLRTENGRLRIQLRYAWKQVAEMKSFLNDYGMVWVGHGEDPGAADGRQRVGSGGRVLSADSKGPDGEAGPMPPRPPEVAAAPAGGGAAMRRRISSPSPSGLSAAAAAAVMSSPPDPHARPTSASHPPPGLPRAGSLPAESSTVSVSSSSAAHPHPHSLAHHAPPSLSPSSSTTSIPSGRPALPPLPKTPPLPGLSAPPAPASISPPPSAPATHSVSGLPFDKQKLLRAVDDLNQMAGDGIGKLVGDRGRAGLGAAGAVLQTPEAVRLVLYRDGLQVHRSPPKPFSDPAAQGILRDVLDGYFPIVLKTEFPDGVPIKVVDRTSESYLSAAATPAPSGNIRTFHDLEESPAAPESKDHFLKRLPQTVIKNGKVIEIRSEIGRLVGAKGSGGAGGAGGKPDVAIVSTPADALLSTIQRNHVGPLMPAAAPTAAPAIAASPSQGSLGSGPAPLPPTSGSAPEIATLQVKSEDGQQTFILKLQYDDTIGALRKCIDTHRAGAAKAAGKPAATSKYEIRSAFPARAYTEPHETLRQAGLFPNATLFLRALA